MLPGRRSERARIADEMGDGTGDYGDGEAGWDGEADPETVVLVTTNKQVDVDRPVATCVNRKTDWPSFHLLCCCLIHRWHRTLKRDAVSMT